MGMRLARAWFYSSSLLASSLLALAACQVDKSLGDLDDATATATESAGSGTETSSSGSTDDTGAPACLQHPSFTCEVPIDCAFEQCGGPLAEVDAEGCLRPRCNGEPCPDGYTCVNLGAWGSCAASSWSCGPYEGECGCGGTADCSESVSICVQDEQAPPAACNTLTDEASCLAAGCSAFVLAPRVEVDLASGTCSCAGEELEPTCLWFPSGNQGGDDVITPYVATGDDGGFIRLLPASYDETPLGWRTCTDRYDEALCACAQALSCP
jgi:hypothetical protein